MSYHDELRELLAELDEAEELGEFATLSLLRGPAELLLKLPDGVVEAMSRSARWVFRYKP